MARSSSSAATAPDRAGAYFEPTIIANPDQKSEIIQDEVFGPVVTVQRFSDEEQAVAVGERRAKFGLASSVFTGAIGKAMRVARRSSSGTVWINEHFTLASETPHGGVKESGWGKDGSKYALEDYTVIKHIMINTGRSANGIDFAAVRGAVAGLDLEDLAGRRWFGAKGVDHRAGRLAHAFALADAAALALVDLTAGGDPRPLRPGVRAGRARPAARRRSATARGGRWRRRSRRGRTIAALPRPRPSGAPAAAGSVEAGLVCRPAPGLAALVPEGAGWVADADERPLGSDQSNTSVVLGERLLLKAYRRVQPRPQPRPRAQRRTSRRRRRSRACRASRARRRS